MSVLKSETSSCFHFLLWQTVEFQFENIVGSVFLFLFSSISWDVSSQEWRCDLNSSQLSTHKLTQHQHHFCPMWLPWRLYQRVNRKAEADQLNSRLFCLIDGLEALMDINLNEPLANWLELQWGKHVHVCVFVRLNQQCFVCFHINEWH